MVSGSRVGSSLRPRETIDSISARTMPRSSGSARMTPRLTKPCGRRSPVTHPTAPIPHPLPTSRSRRVSVTISKSSTRKVVGATTCRWRGGCLVARRRSTAPHPFRVNTLNARPTSPIRFRTDLSPGGAWMIPGETRPSMPRPPLPMARSMVPRGPLDAGRVVCNSAARNPSNAAPAHRSPAIPPSRSAPGSGLTQEPPSRARSSSNARPMASMASTGSMSTAPDGSDSMFMEIPPNSSTSPVPPPSTTATGTTSPPSAMPPEMPTSISTESSTAPSQAPPSAACPRPSASASAPTSGIPSTSSAAHSTTSVSSIAISAPRKSHKSAINPPPFPRKPSTSG